MKRKERRLPDNYTEAPANYKLGYTLDKCLRSHYGLGHFKEDFPYVWKRVGLYHDKWMPVDDYWIAPDGALYSGRAGKILKPDPPIGSVGKSYPSYKIRCTDGKQHHLYAHILVSDAFLTDFFKVLAPIINHRDGCKGNPRLSNLERSTGSLNAQHFQAEIKSKR